MWIGKENTNSFNQNKVTKEKSKVRADRKEVEIPKYTNNCIQY